MGEEREEGVAGGGSGQERWSSAPLDPEPHVEHLGSTQNSAPAQHSVTLCYHSVTLCLLNSEKMVAVAGSMLDAAAAILTPLQPHAPGSSGLGCQTL